MKASITSVNMDTFYLQRLLNVVALIFGLCVSTYSQAEPLRYNLPSDSKFLPYTGTGDADKPGIYDELIPILMARAEIPIEPVDLPIKRAIKSLEDGLIDFDFVSRDWFPNGYIGEGFIASEPIFTMTEYYITLPQNRSLFMTPESLVGKVVGTITGYYYFNEKAFIRMDFRTERSVIEGLERNRFEVAILEEMTAHYWSAQTGISIGFAGVHTQGKILMRLRDEHESLLPSINSAVRTLKQQGTIERIIEKYRNATLVDR